MTAVAAESQGNGHDRRTYPDDPAIARSEQALVEVHLLRAELGEVARDTRRAVDLIEAHVAGSGGREKELRKLIFAVATAVGVLAAAVPQCSSAAPVAQAILETLVQED